MVRNMVAPVMLLDDFGLRLSFAKTSKTRLLAHCLVGEVTWRIGE